ncbi:MAG TPA: DUF1592 domain-containing protein, partial [Polyangiaceae bacterium]|nr:DUF1592 domain-containing protein [Polyangiaceae bacterium]
MRSQLAIFLGLVVSLGCASEPDGSSSAGSDPSSPPPDQQPQPGDPQGSCEPRQLPLQPLRRLSGVQYHNTLRDLFGAELATPLLEGSLFPVTELEHGFEGDAEANVVNTAESNAIEDNAERIAALILENADPYLRTLMPCALPETIDDAAIDGCVDDFIDGFGARAYRRPISEGERSVLRGLYDGLRPDQGARVAWAAMLQLIVQSPALLYRVERGTEEVAPGMLRLGGHELATRLSYFLTGSMPDAELAAAVDAGELASVEQVVAHAERLLASPGFDSVQARFHSDWLHLYELERAARDPALFPSFSAELRDSLLAEPAELARGGQGRGVDERRRRVHVARQRGQHVAQDLALDEGATVNRVGPVRL